METAVYIILVPMVYVAFGIFIFGTLIRLFQRFRDPKNPTTLQIYPERRPAPMWALLDALLMPTVRKHNPVLWVFLMAFHLCFFLVIIGHIELFKEFRILQIIEHEVFLGKGVLGVILSISLLYFLFRRFRSPIRELSVPEDYYLLILLFLTVIFGSQMDWARRWYEYDGLLVEDYRAYLTSLLVFKPEVDTSISYSGHSFMLILHVFFANLFLIFFPFTKIMHSFLTIPMNRLRRGK